MNIYLPIFIKKSYMYQTFWFTAFAHTVLQPYIHNVLELVEFINQPSESRIIYKYNKIRVQGTESQN